jgi:hypothetical protein
MVGFRPLGPEYTPASSDLPPAHQVWTPSSLDLQPDTLRVSLGTLETFRTALITK